MKKVGESFELAGITWKVLEVTESGCKCLAKSIDDMEFSEDTNNWSESDLRKYLNGEYLEKLEAEVGAENILQFKRDLTSLDGLKEYGSCEDKVSLLTLDEYRQHREHIPNSGDWFWLITPWSTKSNGWEHSVAVVAPAGNVYWNFYYGWGGVRPICIFSSAIFESKEG